MQLCNIIGSPGTGKSTLAQQLALKFNCAGNVVGIVSLDLFKDGLRFVLQKYPETEFRQLEYPSILFIEPSKRLSREQAILAARMKGKLNAIVTEVLTPYAVISEGFYFPCNDQETVFLHRSEKFLRDVHQARQLKRHGHINVEKLQNELAVILGNQDELLTLMKSEGKRYSVNPDVEDVKQGLCHHAYDEVMFMPGTHYVNPMSVLEKLFGVLGIHVGLSELFRTGVNYAWERTKPKEV